MIKFKKLNPEAVIPTRATALSAGYDLASLESVLIAPGKQHIFKTGLAVAVPGGHVGMIRPRSGLAVRFGAHTLAGVIDADYTGEICVLLLNTGDRHMPVQRGDRIAQLVVHSCVMESCEVDTLDETERGNNGFGSTDRKSCEQQDGKHIALKDIYQQPIETAPMKGEFLAFRDGEWVVVERCTYPHIRDNLVIDRATGKWWSPKTWLPITN